MKFYSYKEAKSCGQLKYYFNKTEEYYLEITPFNYAKNDK